MHTFAKHKPLGLLGRYVESFWYRPAVETHASGMLILPSGRAELVLSLGGARQASWRFTAQDARCRQLHFATVRLPTCDPTATVLDGRAAALGVSFKPHGLRRFVRPALGGIGDNALPLAELWGHAADELADRLSSAVSPSEMFRMLEAALWQQMQQPSRDQAKLDRANELLSDPFVNRSIRAVADAVDLPQRRLLHLFREDVGMSPKAYARIARFSTALHLVRLKGMERWTDVAAMCNYFDQSHFVREFRALAGMTPSSYLQRRTTGHAHCLPWAAPAARVDVTTGTGLLAATGSLFESA